MSSIRMESKTNPGYYKDVTPQEVSSVTNSSPVEVVTANGEFISPHDFDTTEAWRKMGSKDHNSKVFSGLFQKKK